VKKLVVVVILSINSLTPLIASLAIHPCLVAVKKVFYNFRGLERKFNQEIVDLSLCRPL
jgi:hypothetical protein